jgi:predicted outer membrane protein
MVQDHEKDVAAFRKEAQSGQNPAVKGFAQAYLPVLEQHLQMARLCCMDPYVNRGKIYIISMS